jgi:hypothetical protein
VISSFARALVAGLALSACAPPAQGPVPIAWGRDACAHCQMVISAQEFAAQARVDGKPYKFDDPGCMLFWLDLEERAGRAAGELWVMDRERGEWLDARAAAWRSGERTPMGYGFAAVAAPRADTLDFEGVRAALRAREAERERARRAD